MKTLKYTLFLLVSLFSHELLAGDLFTNTNQSIHFLRHLARGASGEIDAVYTNPAGLTRLSEGIHLSINNQSAFQTRTIRSTSQLFTKSSEGTNVRTFKGTASAPILPSVIGAYKQDKWVLSGMLSVTGGGGKATFDKGLPSFENLIAKGADLLSQLGGVPANYTVDQHMKGANFIFGGQLGGTYQINPYLSAYVGFRMNFVHNRYEGYIREFAVTALGDQTGAVLSQYSANASNLPEEVARLVYFANKASTNEGVRLESKQSGWGISPIIGVSYHKNGLTLAGKYEHKARLNVENDTKIDDTGMFRDGVNTAHDIPAFLSLAVGYQPIPKLSVTAEYHHFFDSKARMQNDKQRDAGNTNEYLLGVEYQLNNFLLLSAGGQMTAYGVGDNYQQDLSFVCNSYSLGLGGAIQVSPRAKLNLGYFWTVYSDYTKTPGGGVTAAVRTEQDVFQRTNKVFGVGVDFLF